MYYGFPSGFTRGLCKLARLPYDSKMVCPFTLTLTHQGQIRIQKKKIKSFYQVKGHKELQLQEIDLRSRPKVNTVNGGRNLMAKILVYTRGCSPFPMNTYVYEDGSCSARLASSYYTLRKHFANGSYIRAANLDS